MEFIVNPFAARLVERAQRLKQEAGDNDQRMHLVVVGLKEKDRGGQWLDSDVLCFSLAPLKDYLPLGSTIGATG